MESPESGTSPRLELWILEPQPDGSVKALLVGTVIDGRIFFPDEK